MLVFLSALLTTCLGFAQNVTLDNQTPYPAASKSKVAIQWASSAKDVQENNEASIRRAVLKQETLLPLTQSGKTTLTVPNKAAYFRVIVWSKGGADPDFLTNWVDLVPNKTYTLKTEHLVPSVLILGSGC